MTSFTSLPDDVLLEIIIASHSSSLFCVNQRMHSLLKRASNHTRSQYLLSAWKDYFLEDPDCDEERQQVLDYCLRFPICNHEVLKKLNHSIMDEDVLAGFIDIHHKKNMSHYVTHPDSTSARSISPKAFFGVFNLPKRIFRIADNFKSSTTYPHDITPSVSHLSGLSQSQDIYWPLLCAMSRFDSLAPLNIMPTADLVLLVTILCLHTPTPSIRDSEESAQECTKLVNSNKGYSLARAVFRQNLGLCSLLMAFGADPERHGGLAITMACRSNWLEGLQHLTQIDDLEQWRWTEAVNILRSWCLNRYESDLSPEVSPLLAGTKHDPAHFKRSTINRIQACRPSDASLSSLKLLKSNRRLQHSPNSKMRASVTEAHLHAAVRCEAIEVANYLIDEKHVRVDMKVINELTAADERRQLKQIEETQLARDRQEQLLAKQKRKRKRNSGDEGGEGRRRRYRREFVGEEEEEEDEGQEEQYEQQYEQQEEEQEEELQEEEQQEEQQEEVEGEEQGVYAREEQGVYAREEQDVYAREEQDVYAGGEQPVYDQEEQPVYDQEEGDIDYYDEMEQGRAETPELPPRYVWPSWLPRSNSAHYWHSSDRDEENVQEEQDVQLSPRSPSPEYTRQCLGEPLDTFV
ncbi:unnamed protein product [Sympodiomycopsis kandeliae]